MATELGAARISVGLDTSKVAGEIKRAFAGVDADGAAAGKAAGGGFASGFKSLVGPALALAGGAIFGGLIGEAARASDATDKFKATMNFAGIDTSGIEAATAAAQEFADSTVYDLPTIQNTMAQLASNGIKDYTGLTKAAGNLNAVAGGNAETFKSVAMTMTQTAGAGKLTTENWNQLADAIPGAAGPLMKALEESGAYTGNFRDQMAEGAITADEFNEALMKLGNDPIAVEAAKSTATFEGALGNLQATITGGLTSALNTMKPLITGAMTGVATALGATFDWIGGAFNGLRDLFVKGDFTGALANAFRVEEDSGFVDFLFRVRDAAIGVGNSFKVIATGDFKGGIFGLEEDSGFVDFLFNVREGIGGVVESAKLLVTGDFKGGIFGLEEDSRLVDFLFDVREGIGGVFDAAGLLITGDFKGGLFGVEEDSGLVDFILNLREGIGNLVSSIGPVAGQFLALWQAASPLSIVFAAIQPLLPQLVGMFGQLAGVVGGTLSSVFAALLPMVMQLSSVLSQSLGAVLAAVLPTVVTMITMLGNTISQLLPIIMPIVATIIQLATALISQLAPIITNLVSAILPPLVDVFGNILGAIGPVISTVAGVLIPVIQALMPVVVTVFSVVADVIKNAMQVVQGIIQVVTGIISGDWGKVWQGIQNVFSGIWNTILSVVKGVLQTIGQVVISGLGLVANFVGSALGNIGRFFADTWNNVVNGVSSMIGNVVGFFSGLIGRITGAIGNAGAALFSVGKNIIQGLIDGIGSMMGAIGRAVISIVPEAIRGPFESLLGIHSPSRVFMGYGVNIGQGLINGIDGMHSKIESAVTGMVSVPSVPSFGSPSYSPAVVGAGSAGGFPSSLRLVVDGHEFTAYVDGRVGSGMNQVASVAGGRMR